jgi:hypothetical protein
MAITLYGVLYERYNVGDTGQNNIYDINWSAQSFTVGNTGNNNTISLYSVRLKLFKTGTIGNINISIKNVDGSFKPTGPDLSTGTLDGNNVDVSAKWYEIFMSPYNLSPSTQYAIVVNVAGNGSNFLKWSRKDTTATYGGGDEINSGDGGSSWTIISGYDFMFEVWGYGSMNIGTSGSQEISKDYPAVEGLIAGTTKQTGEIFLKPETDLTLSHQHWGSI